MRGTELCQEEREEIFAGVAAGRTCRAIGARLGRDASVISREIARNGGRGAYRPSGAQVRADAGRARPKTALLAGNKRLHDEVAQGLVKDRSPQQVAAVNGNRM